MKNDYQPVIGLEVHVELKTNSKMFCRCSADYFGNKPNTHTCPVCLGLPGALPVPNKTAIEWCMKIGLALNCSLPLVSKFDRKNYFYPDLAKGYQISQYDEPFALGGYIEVFREKESQEIKRIGITRVHMEEDTGKLVHETVDGKKVSLIDFNRSGVPLVEIVTEPDFENEYQVVQYLQKLQKIVRYLGVSNADMEKGDMRLEPNISLRKVGEEGLPNYKVEVKNINSFRFVEKAILYEVKRHQELLDKNETPPQETRGWDEAHQRTVSQRIKEEANDYRYFPEPDIPPLKWTQNYIEQLKSTMPELPDDKIKRFEKEFLLSYYDAEILTRDIELANYYEEAVKVGKDHKVEAKKIANVIINKKIDISSVLPAHLIKQVMEESTIVEMSDTELNNIIETVITENQKAVEDFKKGKETVIMFLVGQVMKTARQKIAPDRVKSLLLAKLQ
jgi:aspartyl-tRNA(Asn)/glutamyl-tRNA(Gln) amidotransferase subunit B